MNRILYCFSVIAAALGMASCRPADLTPEFSAQPITSVSAFVSVNGYDNVEFVGSVKEGSNRIVIEFPYFYPVESDARISEDILKNVKVTAVLANNARIEPPILKMDLTQENVIKVIDQVKAEHEYIVTGRIVKSNACDITDFSIPELNLSGVISGTDISLVVLDELPEVKASVTLSPHATISPDPRETMMDYNEPVEFVVTAHDGVTKKTYTVRKNVPDKLETGLRSGSAKVLFEKQMIADFGVGPNNTRGLAVSGDYLIMNNADQPYVVMNRMTGEKVGTIDASTVGTGVANFYITSDDSGNILVNNLTPNSGNSLKIWKIKDKDSAPELFVEWDAAGVAYGRKVSVQGSIDSDAVITAPAHAGNVFARWVVKGGVLQSQTPDIVTPSGAGAWTTNCDIIYTEPVATSDYFLHGYSTNQLAWIDGNTNVTKAQLGQLSVNFIPNALDLVEFNNAVYLAATQANSFTWGVADYAWLLDVSSTDKFTGGLDTATNAAGNPVECPAIVWKTYGTYGANSITGGTVNGNGTSDIVMSVSDNGYYLYMYFMFTNGYVVGVQFDCIDI